MRNHSAKDTSDGRQKPVHEIMPRKWIAAPHTSVALTRDFLTSAKLRRNLAQQINHCFLVYGAIFGLHGAVLWTADFAEGDLTLSYTNGPTWNPSDQSMNTAKAFLYFPSNRIIVLIGHVV